MTREHVFGDWLARIGLDTDPVAYRAGPLNRIGRDLGVRAPFGQTVRDVCTTCNGGWMSRLEGVAARVLTPLILGSPSTIEAADLGAIAAWVQKTALVAMLVSPRDDREHGYGLPLSEYRRLYDIRDAQEPLPATTAWIGRYSGQKRSASVWVVPLLVRIEGEKELDRPQGYVMTIVLGQLLLHAVRFTTPTLELALTNPRDMPQLWPTARTVAWPSGAPVDDTVFLSFSQGRDLQVATPHIALEPWRPATDLPASRTVGRMIELPTICGQHVSYYPARLVNEAAIQRFYAFMTTCDCGHAYLVVTASDGARCKTADTPEAIANLYETLFGEEVLIEDENGAFVCKRLTHLV